MTVPISIAVIVILEALLAIFLIIKKKTLTIGQTTGCVILILVALIIRYKLLYYVSQDYTIFLSQWINSMKEYGINALGMNVGNYNIPYMFILLCISKIESVDSMLMIKVISIFFDILLAWASMQIVLMLTQSEKKATICYLAALLLPTTVINSAMWGQCDSIYVSMAVLSIFFALDEKPWLSVIAIAISFGFKLQAIFVMPVFAYFLFTKRIKWYHLTAFPIVYILLMIPGMFAGIGIKESLLMYTTQTGTIGGGYSYNAPSFLAIIQAGKTALYALNTDKAIVIVSKVFIVLAMLYTGIIMIISFVSNKQIEKDHILIIVICALLSLGIPYILPHMHERYFYMADAFLLILSICNLRYLKNIILTQVSSLGCYVIYYNNVVTNSYGPTYIFAMLMGISLVLLFFDFCKELHGRN